MVHGSGRQKAGERKKRSEKEEKNYSCGGYFMVITNASCYRFEKEAVEHIPCGKECKRRKKL